MFINNGNIIEKGTHEKFIRKNGEYKKLVENQLIKTHLSN